MAQAAGYQLAGRQHSSWVLWVWNGVLDDHDVDGGEFESNLSFKLAGCLQLCSVDSKRRVRPSV
jgi:hypothetical protein